MITPRLRDASPYSSAPRSAAIAMARLSPDHVAPAVENEPEVSRDLQLRAVFA